MLKIFANFLADESGAVTVDWVVLTAAIIGMGMLVLLPVALESESLSANIASNVGGIPVGYTSTD